MSEGKRILVFTNIPLGIEVTRTVNLVELEEGTAEVLPEDGEFVTIVATFPDAAPEPAVPPAASAADDWMSVAHAELGQRERGGADGNPRIEEYHRAAGGRAEEEVPWCSSFANFCVTKAGLRGTGSKRARSWLDWGEGLAKPQPGCVVVLERGAPPKGHVGFFVGSGRPGWVSVLGGNQGDAVSVAEYREDRVLGYRWPSQGMLHGLQVPATGDALAGVRSAGLAPPRVASAFSALRKEYGCYFVACTVRPDRMVEADACCRRIEVGKARYSALARKTGVPWHVIGLLHHMEADCDFGKHLHNGDPLTTRTVRKPAGRPKATPASGGAYGWEESALDALSDMRAQDGWSVERLLFEAETYNGFGYRRRGLPSAYLWSGSNLYVRGKFTKDGQFDAQAVSGQLGVGVVLRRLADRELLVDL